MTSLVCQTLPIRRHLILAALAPIAVAVLVAGVAVFGRLAMRPRVLYYRAAPSITRIAHGRDAHGYAWHARRTQRAAETAKGASVGAPATF